MSTPSLFQSPTSTVSSGVAEAMTLSATPVAMEFFT